MPRHDRAVVTSERFQRQIDRLLDEAEQAIRELAWETVRDRAAAVLALDSGNADALAYRDSAQKALVASTAAPMVQPTAAAPHLPASFVNGRYNVVKFLGEGGKKKVYLAHDSQLDRDVAFALIKTEGLDETARERVVREAQAMGRLGSHPNIVTVYDIGEEAGQPYLVLPLLPGGDVEGVIEKAPDHRLPLEQAVGIAIDTCQGLEFAHAKGIIHRDLKPGNVWLAEDSRAMIGDFGLAVAVDRSRLTQAGMMVGTASYMPPEQAMGGQVTAQSDLYSLGCMLYEMVTGRPPFVGDESVAIISQHLNTPPVAPSWHRPDCSAVLEALILRLMEKDASKRPASAAEVRRALESVTAGTPIAAPAADAPQGPDPLYQRVFVGREQELRQLQQGFDAALSGNGSLAMVVGEPGIGKTALCEQLATYVAMRGGKTLVGHCYEEGSLSLPYLPFVEAMRSYVLTRETDGLKADLGSGAADVARIVSEVRDKVQVSPAPAMESEEQRYRLLQAVTAFLRSASMVQPLLIVLEDLHDADRESLDLIVRLSRNLEGARLLVVGTYRDVEVDRTHPLSATLAELRRAATFLRIPLRGLTIDEVHRMMSAIRGQEVSWDRAEAIHRQTEGNPLFVQEVLRYLVEEGYVVREGDRYVRTDAGGPEAGIPEGLRDAIGKRLARLSERGNQVLGVASVIGREFRLDVLQRVAELPEDDLFAVIQEATQRAIVEERSRIGVVEYRFTHAFFRQILYEETIAPRRIRLHQRVARALEEVYARRLDEHAAELAEHYSHSSSADDLTRAVEYGEMAARRALGVHAYGEAARHLEQALRVQDVLDPDDRPKRCDLLVSLGTAMMVAGDAKRAHEEIAPEALALAEGLDDRKRAARACWLALEAMNRDLTANAWRTPLYREWTTRADRFCVEDTMERVWTDVALADLCQAEGRENDSWPLYRRALEQARKIDYRPGIFYAGSRFVLNMSAPHHRDEQARLAAEFAALPSEGAGRSLGTVLWLCTSIRLNAGDREQAEAYQRRLSEYAAQTQDPVVRQRCNGTEAGLLLCDGRFEEVIVRRLHGPVSVRALIYLGRLDELDEVLARREFGSAAGTPHRTLILAHQGKRDAAEQELRAFIEQTGISREAGTNQLTHFLESALMIGAVDIVEMLSTQLAGLAASLTFGTNSIPSCVGRQLGAAAAMLGRTEEARASYEQAIDVCTRARCRPELALSRLQLAELLLEHYPDERATAIEHLDFAIAEFRDMKMQPSLERALSHRRLLKA